MNCDGKRRGSEDSGDAPDGVSHTEDSGALWEHVTKDVTPLSKNTVAPVPVSFKMTASAPARAKMDQLAIAGIPQGREVDRRTAQKLRRGQYPIDYVLDLHGLTQPAAHKKLLEAVTALYRQGGRCLLVITGKGKTGPGVLRQRAPEWLASPALTGIVLRVEEAQPAHGGGGALYVLLRRNKNNRERSNIY